RSISTQEIIERTIYALINEGSRILEEGNALRASDIDLVYVHGYGFPPDRGGPMHYADQVGLREVYRRVLKFCEIHGTAWEASTLLAALAASQSSFQAWDNSREVGEGTP